MENNEQELNDVAAQAAMQDAQADATNTTADEAVNADAESDADVANENEPEATAEDAVADVATLQSEIEALKAQLKGVEDKAKSQLSDMARAAAEADNRRKRAEADVEKERKYGNEKLLKALLPVVDSLELALQHTNKDDESNKAIYEGIENTRALFLKELQSFGVEQIDPVGQPFDPNAHQAISMVPTKDLAPNHVLSVMQKGYLLNGRVVRAAMVMVSKALPSATGDKKVDLEA